jgi:hypothetical protein
MRILNRDRGRFIAQQRSREFDCPQEPLPEKFNVLLCLMDGAERRRHIQARLNALDPRPGPEVDDPNAPPAAKR